MKFKNLKVGNFYTFEGKRRGWSYVWLILYNNGKTMHCIEAIYEDVRGQLWTNKYSKSSYKEYCNVSSVRRINKNFIEAFEINKSFKSFEIEGGKINSLIRRIIIESIYK